jgi:hypothetical protein
MRRYWFVLVAGLLTWGPARAGSWAEGMFEEFSKDFGSVPRGQLLTHPFTIKNNTGRTVTISGVRVSCTLCTSATVATGQLQAGQETSVAVQMDSSKFLGTKTVYIYVTFSEPQFEEVRLWIQANSRDDVNLTPDAIAFGRIQRGDATAKSVTITFYGNTASEVTGVQSESNFIQAKVGDARRGASEVSYDLSVQLRPDTPVGRWYSDIWVSTNNAAIPRVRVPLTVEIAAPITVNFTTLSLGEIKVGETAERKLVVRGSTPFKITAVKGTDKLIEVKDSTPESKEQHILTVRLKGDKVGDVSRTLKVVTDLKDQGEVEFVAKGHIVP